MVGADESGQDQQGFHERSTDVDTLADDGNSTLEERTVRLLHELSEEELIARARLTHFFHDCQAGHPEVTVDTFVRHALQFSFELSAGFPTLHTLEVCSVQVAVAATVLQGAAGETGLSGDGVDGFHGESLDVVDLTSIATVQKVTS